MEQVKIAVTIVAIIVTGFFLVQTYIIGQKLKRAKQVDDRYIKLMEFRKTLETKDKQLFIKLPTFAEMLNSNKPLTIEAWSK